MPAATWGGGCRLVVRAKGTERNWEENKTAGSQATLPGLQIAALAVLISRGWRGALIEGVAGLRAPGHLLVHIYKALFSLLWFIQAWD